MLILSALSLGKPIGETGTLRPNFANGTKTPLARPVKLCLRHNSLLLGFGVLNLILGGIILFSKARIALIKLVMPDAPSE